MKRSALVALVGVAAALLVAACGGSAPSASTPSPVHSALSGEPPLIQVDGYQYQDPTAEQLESMDLEHFTQIKDIFPEAFQAASAHRVVGPGLGETWIAEIQLSSQLADPGLQEEMVAGMAEQGMSRNDPPMQLRTISGETVAVGQMTSEGTAMPVFVWIHGDVMTMVIGEQGTQLEPYVTDYLKVAHSA